ncbi:hypothetical protein EON79_18865 [bacterium]|nr:MAG: hypothetical protein EON79_18865 [bacterium]
MNKPLLNMEPGAVLSGILAMGVSAVLLVGYVVLLHKPGRQIEVPMLVRSIPIPPSLTPPAHPVPTSGKLYTFRRVELRQKS